MNKPQRHTCILRLADCATAATFGIGVKDSSAMCLGCMMPVTTCRPKAGALLIGHFVGGPTRGYRFTLDEAVDVYPHADSLNGTAEELVARAALHKAVCQYIDGALLRDVLSAVTAAAPKILTEDEPVVYILLDRPETENVRVRARAAHRKGEKARVVVSLELPELVASPVPAPSPTPPPLVVQGASAVLLAFGASAVLRRQAVQRRRAAGQSLNLAELDAEVEAAGLAPEVYVVLRDGHRFVALNRMYGVVRTMTRDEVRALLNLPTTAITSAWDDWAWEGRTCPAVWLAFVGSDEAKLLDGPVAFPATFFSTPNPTV